MEGKKVNRRDFLKKIADSSLLLFSISSIPDFVLAVEQPLVDNVNSEKKNETKENPFGLPDWFLENRVHAHVRYTLKMMEKNPKFLSEGNKLLKDLGAKVIVRHLKTADEGAWWPTKYGKTEPFVKKFSSNLAKEIIDNAHNLGLKIIAYYRHMEDKYISKEYPDWLCKDWRGRKIYTLSKRGYHLCFNSPYRKTVEGRLKELAKLGADGFYFDATHMPIYGCWCNFCKKKFKQQYGMEPPKKPDPKDVIWAKYYVEFNNRTVEETFIEWKKAVKSINPNVVFIISLHLYPTLLDHHLSSRLMTIADSVKTEFDIPIREHAPKKKKFLFFMSSTYSFKKEVKLALGLSLVRDGAYERPAHVWIPEAISKDIANLATAIVLSTGNIANVNIIENFLLKNKDIFNTVRKWNILLQENLNLKDLLPYSEIGILFSENTRKEYIPAYEKYFREILVPLYEVFEFLFSKKFLVKIYTDQTVSRLTKDYTKILFVPTFHGLDNITKNYINEFNIRGGRIFSNIKEFMFYVKKKYTPSIEFNTDINSFINVFKEKSNFIIICSNGNHIIDIYNYKNQKKILKIKPTWLDIKINFSHNKKISLVNILENKVISNAQGYSIFRIRNIRDFIVLRLHKK